MRIGLFYSLLACLALFGCHKNNSCKGEKAVFKDLGGLDGCGFVIELNTGKRLEPMNLNSFAITPADGKKICVKYHTTAGGSICMVGEIVAIDCISER